MIEEKDSFEVFVPGRLCILGEHSDWAGQYSNTNPSVLSGHTLVCATNEGLHAKVNSKYLLDESKCSLYFQSSQANIEEPLSVALDFSLLKELAAQGGFYSYVLGTSAAIISHQSFENRSNRRSIQLSIHNYHTSLPLKKGLSSSAAVCVLVVLAFNTVFNLNLTEADIMEIAYQGEMLTPSKCGRMDQCVAMGSGAIALMDFDSNRATLRRLFCKSPLYFVVVDLKAGKDTVVILRDLNACFPFPSNSTQELMIEYVTSIDAISRQGCQAIEEGNVSQLAECMTQAQSEFDRCAIPNCPSQLTSPVLHSLISDAKLRSMALAVKGVGSQGDGSAQILCETAESQEQVLNYIKYLGLDAFRLTIPSSSL